MTNTDIANETTFLHNTDFLKYAICEQKMRLDVRKQNKKRKRFMFLKMHFPTTVELYATWNFLEHFEYFLNVFAKYEQIFTIFCAQILYIYPSNIM